MKMVAYHKGLSNPALDTACPYCRVTEDASAKHQLYVGSHHCVAPHAWGKEEVRQIVTEACNLADYENCCISAKLRKKEER